MKACRIRTLKADHRAMLAKLVAADLGNRLVTETTQPVTPVGTRFCQLIGIGQNMKKARLATTVGSKHE